MLPTPIASTSILVTTLMIHTSTLCFALTTRFLLLLAVLQCKSQLSRSSLLLVRTPSPRKSFPLRLLPIPLIFCSSPTLRLPQCQYLSANLPLTLRPPSRNLLPPRSYLFLMILLILPPFLCPSLKKNLLSPSTQLFQLLLFLPRNPLCTTIGEDQRKPRPLFFPLSIHHSTCLRSHPRPIVT